MEKERRVSVVVTQEMQDKINSMSALHKITQAETVNAMFNSCDPDVWQKECSAARKKELDSRVSKASVLKRLKKLSSPELAKLERLLAEEESI